MPAGRSTRCMSSTKQRSIGGTGHTAGSLLAISSIAAIYASLGMLTAAKKYTLGLASIAQSSHDSGDRELVPIAMFYAANYDHQAGGWVSSAELFTVASLAQAAYAADPWNSDWYPTCCLPSTIRPLPRSWHNSCDLRLCNPSSTSWTGATSATSSAKFLDRLAAETPRTEEEWLDNLIDMTGPPFSDVGPQRVIAFEALGVRWTVHGRNDQPTASRFGGFQLFPAKFPVELAITPIR